jgi:hypothetical protein
MADVGSIGFAIMIPNHGAGGVIAPVAAASPRRFAG